jgi:hypothetical protein
MHGTKANVIVRQGKEQNYRPELYVESAAGVKNDNLKLAVEKVIANISWEYEGLKVEQQGNTVHIVIPDKYRIGHEAHFGQVMKRFLKYMEQGKVPEWETANMRVKYYTTTKALEMAQK